MGLPSLPPLFPRKVKVPQTGYYFKPVMGIISGKLVPFRGARVGLLHQSGYNAFSPREEFLMPTFAERLRQLREAAGFTQAALAEKSGLPLGSVRNYEQGQREPYWAGFLKLCKALGAPPESFAACASKDQNKGRAKGARRPGRK